MWHQLSKELTPQVAKPNLSPLPSSALSGAVPMASGLEQPRPVLVPFLQLSHVAFPLLLPERCLVALGSLGGGCHSG